MLSFLKKYFLPLVIICVISTLLLVFAFIYRQFINENQGMFMVIFTGVVAFSTAVYAIFTWRLSDETIKMREVQTEPNVSIIIEPREERMALINMKIRNIGSGPAYGIRFKIAPDFEYFNEKNLSQIMEGVKYLAPNQKRQFFLTNLAEDHDKKINNPFKIKASYKDKFDKKFEETFIIDFSEFEGMFERKPPLHQIAESLESIKTHIDQFSVGSNKLKTIVYTKKDIENENKLPVERTKQRIKQDQKKKQF